MTPQALMGAPAPDGNPGLGPWDMVQTGVAVALTFLAGCLALRVVSPGGGHAPCLGAFSLLGGLAWGAVKLGPEGRSRLFRRATRLPSGPTRVWALTAGAWTITLGVHSLLYWTAASMLPDLLGNDPPPPPAWCAILLSPFVEELLFRGVIQDGLARRFGTVTGLLASSMLFGLCHGAVLESTSAFLFGVAVGFLFARTRSLVPCFALHLANNLLAAWVATRAMAIP